MFDDKQMLNQAEALQAESCEAVGLAKRAIELGAQFLEDNPPAGVRCQLMAELERLRVKCQTVEALAGANYEKVFDLAEANKGEEEAVGVEA